MLEIGCEGASTRPDIMSVDGSPLLRAPRVSTALGFAGCQALSPGKRERPSTDLQVLSPETDKNTMNFQTVEAASTDHLKGLLQQYDSLMATLLREILAPHYKIAKESRSRIEDDIVASHIHEKRLLEQEHHLEVGDLSMPVQAQDDMFSEEISASMMASEDVESPQLNMPQVYHPSVPVSAIDPTQRKKRSVNGYAKHRRSDMSNMPSRSEHPRVHAAATEIGSNQHRRASA